MAIPDYQSIMLPLLDLYLSGEFAKEALTDRKVRFEKTILALERERVELASHLEAQVLNNPGVRSQGGRRSDSNRR